MKRQCYSLVFIIFLQSCNQPFDPRGPYTEKLVVFSVLSNDRDVQYVRVYSSYNSADFDPLSNTTDNQITDAQVTLSAAGKIYSFKDTLLTRPDTSRYTAKLHSYVASPLQLVPGATYNLQVQSPSLGTASSTITLPSSAQVTEVTGGIVLDQPLDYKTDVEIKYRTTVANLAPGFVYRLFLDYDVLTENGWSSRRTEVPVTYRDSATSASTSIPVGTSFPDFSRSFFRTMVATYYNGGYLAALIKIYSMYPNNKMIFKRVVFIFLQAEKNFYNYYNISNGFRDSHSIRTDEPAYWNINGGYGLFAGTTVDSLVHVLPASFRFNR